MIKLTHKIFIILIPVLFCGVLYSQEENDMPVVSQNYEAQSFFIEGKTLELQYKLIPALESYKTALKYDNAPGIHYAIANIYYNTDKFPEAIFEINNALKLDSNEIDYLELKGNIYYRQDNYDKAAEVYETIVSIDSDYVYGLYFLARMYQEMKSPSKAIIIYERITDLIGFDYEVLKRMYEIYFNYKEYDKCLEVLTYVLKLNPYDQLAKQQLAGLYVRIGKFEQARMIYEELEAMNPGDKVLNTELIKIYLNTGEIDMGLKKFAKTLNKDTLNYEEKLQVGEIYYKMISSDSSSTGAAINIFRNLISEYPDKWLPYFYAGSIEYFAKNNKVAEEYFSKAELYADTSKDAFYQIGYTYFEQGNINKSEDVFVKGLKLYPDDYLLNYFYGLSLQRDNKAKEAIKYYEKAHDLSPKDVQIMGTLAMAYNTEKMFKESDELYEEALFLDPDNALILNNYAYNLSVRNEKLEKSLSMAQRAIAKEPDNSSYLDTIGWIYFKLGQNEQAVVYISKAISKNGSNAVLQDHLGDVYNAMHDYDNAVKYWKKALELSPASSEIKQKIEKVQK